MSSFVLKVNAYSKDTSMPIIDSADLSFNELPPVESDAWEFFALDGTDASLTGTINSRTLAKQNTVTAGSGYFTLAIGSNDKNALVSGFSDSLIQTQAMVIRLGSLPSNGAIPIVAGAFASATGSAVFLDYNTLSIRRQFRPAITASEQAYSSLMNSWLFIALSENGGTSQMDSIMFCSTNGGTPYSVERTDAIAKAVASSGIGLGHVNYVTSAAQTTINMDVAEYAIFSTAKSPSDLSAMYARAKRRMTARGLTLL
jgi:hypothetical protein